MPFTLRQSKAGGNDAAIACKAALGLAGETG
jgi:hypothetical protein